MSFPPIRLKPLLYLIILSLPTTPLLLGQTSTPTPPVDTDGDGVPDHRDGWPQHKQLSTARVPELQYVVINLGHGIGYGINNLGDVVGAAYNANGEREAVLWHVGQPPTFLGFLTQDQIRQSLEHRLGNQRCTTDHRPLSLHLGCKCFGRIPTHRPTRYGTTIGPSTHFFGRLAL